MTREAAPFSLQLRTRTDRLLHCTVSEILHGDALFRGVPSLDAFSMGLSAHPLMLMGCFHRSILHCSINSLTFSFITSTHAKSTSQLFRLHWHCALAYRGHAPGWKLSEAGLWHCCLGWRL